MYDFEPKGDVISGPPALEPNADNLILKGQQVTLTPLTLEHSPALFKNLGGLGTEPLYTYLPEGPFENLAAFTAHMKNLIEDPMFFPITITTTSDSHDSVSEPSTARSESSSLVGIICLMNIVPSQRRIEIGHVLYGPSLQRTTAATETVYLLMKYAFEDLHYLRVEWKANQLNEPSTRAALRLGFVFEGVFRKHMIIKGKRRDTWWASVVNDEWFADGGVKGALEMWLNDENFDKEGKQIRKLEDFRKKA